MVWQLFEKDFKYKNLFTKHINDAIINNLQVIVDDVLDISLIEKVGLPVASIYITKSLPEEEVYEEIYEEHFKITGT